MQKILHKLTALTLSLAVVKRLFHAGMHDILLPRGAPYEDRGVYTALFYEVDVQLRTIPKHPEAHL